MELKQLGEDYRISARRCFERAAELRRQLLTERGRSEMETVQLRRRINILIDMARDTAAVGRYLRDYYGRDVHGKTALQREGNGVYDAAWLDALLGVRGRYGEAGARGTE